MGAASGAEVERNSLELLILRRSTRMSLSPFRLCFPPHSAHHLPPMRTRLTALAAVALAVLVVASTATAAAKWFTSPEQRAAKAAVAATRGGKVRKVARENEKGASWEVEVWLPNGRKMDVLLDSKFRAFNVSDERDPGDGPTPPRKGKAGTPAKPDSSGRQAHLAARAAAKAVGGGVLLDVDRERVKGATWEVMFMKLNGQRVNVLLDDKFKVVRVTRGKNAN